MADGAISRIRDGLFIGALAAAEDKSLLEKHGITHIVCAASNVEPKFPSDFAYHTVPVLDLETEDMLSRLSDALAFLDSVPSGGASLIHCVHGQSRSATVAAAYVMWQSGGQVTLDEALAELRSARPLVEPNAGFLAQLSLFERMGASFDPTRGDPAAHAEFRAQQAARARGNAPVTNHALAAPASSTEALQGKLFRCHRCRQPLFLSKHVIFHETTSDQTAFGARKRDAGALRITSASSFFVEPMKWMENIAEVQGRILCPNKRFVAQDGGRFIRRLERTTAATILFSLPISPSSFQPDVFPRPSAVALLLVEDVE